MAVEKAKNVPPFVLWCSATIPTAFDDSMSYYEALCALYKFIQDNLVEPINNNATLLDETIKNMAALKEYVDNYFDNLDVQEEINNKLDDMAEQGQLADIIAAYLQMRSVLAYDTPVQLKAASNLIEGSYAKTYGYKRKDDGVYDLYVVRAKDEGDVDDGYNIIELTADNTLVAERLQQGAKRIVKLLTTDNLQDYLSLVGEKEIVLPKGATLTFTDALLLNSDTTIDMNDATIIFNFDRSSIFDYDWDETLGFMGYAPNDIFTGYNGHKNITIKNGSILGGCSAFMHSQNVTIENVYFKTAGGRHSVQFAACKNFTVKNCTFEGTRDDSTTDASECINIDFCVYGGQPYLSEYSVMYDGTGNKNVLIEGNTFKQTQTADMGYFSAVGTHGNSVETSTVVDGFVVRDNDFGLPREYAIALKNYNNVVIENNILNDSLNTYNGRFIMKRGLVNGAVIANNVVKGTRSFFDSQNPTYAGNRIEIVGNQIIAADPNSDSAAVFALHNIHDSLVAGNNVQYQHHPIHINTRAYYDAVDDNPNDHTINVTIKDNTFEKLIDTATYFGCRVSTCDGLKVVNNEFIHDGNIQSNWQVLFFQNTQTNLVVQDNTTDEPMHFTAITNVNSKFCGNNAIYDQTGNVSSTSTSGTFVNNITNFSEMLVQLGETVNSQMAALKPYLANGAKFDGSRTFIFAAPKNDGTYGKGSLTISDSGASWSYAGDIPIRRIWCKD